MRSYVTWYNKEALLIDKADNKVLVTTFTSELYSGEFLFSIYKNDPKTMAEMLYKATKYMNAKDTMIAQGARPKKRKRHDDQSQDKGKKFAQMNDRGDDRRPRPLPGRVTDFTPLNTPFDQVLMQIRDNPTLV